MSLRTKEKLKAMFNQSKLRQKKLKEQKKKQSQQRLKEIYHHQDVVLKKNLQERRKTTMDNLQALLKQTQQKEKEEQIQPSFKFKVYHSDFYIERDTNEEDLYKTIDELKQWEQEHYPCINWKVWQKIVEETKAMLNQSI